MPKSTSYNFHGIRRYLVLENVVRAGFTVGKGNEFDLGIKEAL